MSGVTRMKSNQVVSVKRLAWPLLASRGLGGRDVLAWASRADGPASRALRALGVGQSPLHDCKRGSNTSGDGGLFPGRGAWSTVDTIVSAPLLACALWPLQGRGLVGDPVSGVEPLPLLEDDCLPLPAHNTPLLLLSGEKTHPYSPCSTCVQIVYLLLFVHKVSRNVCSGGRNTVSFVDRVAQPPWCAGRRGGLSHSLFVCTASPSLTGCGADRHASPLQVVILAREL